MSLCWGFVCSRQENLGVLIAPPRGAKAKFHITFSRRQMLSPSVHLFRCWTSKRPKTQTVYYSETSKQIRVTEQFGPNSLYHAAHPALHTWQMARKSNLNPQSTGFYMCCQSTARMVSKIHQGAQLSSLGTCQKTEWQWSGTTEIGSFPGES